MCMKNLALMMVALATLLLASCSTSKITDSYSAEQGIRDNGNKILVLGLFSEKNRSAKRAMEKELAADMQKFGYHAVAATDEFGPTAFRGLTEEQALRRLQDEGFDHVVTITLVDKNSQKRYVPATYGYRPGFWGYYSYYSPWASPWAYGPGYRSGYTQTNTKYVFETNLYNVQRNTLLYSAESQTVDASSIGTLADDYAKNIVRDMRRKNVLG